MSAKIGRAPARRMALALAKKLKGVVMTASGATVLRRLAEAVADAGGGKRQPEGVGAAGASDGVRRRAGERSCGLKAATRGPRMSCCESQTWAMASRISCSQSGVLAARSRASERAAKMREARCYGTTPAVRLLSVEVRPIATGELHGGRYFSGTYQRT